jgi:hypothetical protein
MNTKRPPFKMLPSRPATLTCDGRHVVSGRASFVFETFLMRRASGVPGDYLIRRSHGREATPWHRLDWTMDEATDALATYGFLGASRVRRAMQTRANREAQGLPVE